MCERAAAKNIDVSDCAKDDINSRSADYAFLRRCVDKRSPRQQVSQESCGSDNRNEALFHAIYLNMNMLNKCRMWLARRLCVRCILYMCLG